MRSASLLARRLPSAFFVVALLSLDALARPSRADTGVSDASTIDAGVSDASPDTAIPDTGEPDSSPDTVVPDAGEPDTAPYYVPSTTTRSAAALRWQKSNCIVVRPNSTGSDDIGDDSDLLAIESAVSRWRDATEGCSFLRIDLLEASPNAEPEFDRSGPNENVVAWVESGWRHDQQAAGITTVFFVDAEGSADDGRILDADIELNGEYFAFSTTVRRTGRTDIENTVVHELGHMMGLDHTCDDGQRTPTPIDNSGETIPSCTPIDQLGPEVTEATMYNFAIPGETKKRSPEAGDIAGICGTYPIDSDPGHCSPVNLSGGGCEVATASQPLAPGDEHGNTTPIALLLGALGLLLATSAWQRRRRSKARSR